MSNLMEMLKATTQRFDQSDTRVDRDKLVEAGGDANLFAMNSAEQLQQRFGELGALDELPTMPDPDSRAGVNESATSLADVDAPVTLDVLERVINKDDLLSTRFLIRGAELCRAIGRVQVRNKSKQIQEHGTGFLISDRLMMTNNHVLESISDARHSVVQFDFVARESGGTPDPVNFLLQPDTFFVTHKPLDYSVVAVQPVNENQQRLADRGWVPLGDRVGTALRGERVNIIQHPNAEPQQVSIRDNQIHDVLDDMLHYVSDTQPGSSGAPVFNDQWRLAALHHSGVPERNDDGNFLLVDGTVWDGSRGQIHLISWIANEGIRIERVMAHLQEKQRPGLSPKEQAMLDAALNNSAQRPAAPAPAPEGKPQAAQAEPKKSPETHAVTLHSAGRPAGGASTAVTLHAGGNTFNVQIAISVVGEGEEPKPGDISTVQIDGRPYYEPAADAAAAGEYYAGIDEALSQAERFDALHALLDDTHERELTYKEARHEHLYPWIDRHPDGELRSVYSKKSMAFEAIMESEGKIANDRLQRSVEFFQTESDEDNRALLIAAMEDSLPYNCEHVVPQSWFNRQKKMKSDLHHLFTCEPDCNSFRSNKAYHQFSPEDEATREDCGQREGNFFEPAANHGVVARATLYFLLRYPGEVGDESIELQAAALETLLRWHEDQPVTDWERHRNAEIHKVQGNRNPLIDHPGWAREIDFTNGFG